MSVTWNDILCAPINAFLPGYDEVSWQCLFLRISAYGYPFLQLLFIRKDDLKFEVEVD